MTALRVRAIEGPSVLTDPEGQMRLSSLSDHEKTVATDPSNPNDSTFRSFVRGLSALSMHAVGFLLTH